MKAKELRQKLQCKANELQTHAENAHASGKDDLAEEFDLRTQMLRDIIEAIIGIDD